MGFITRVPLSVNCSLPLVQQILTFSRKAEQVRKPFYIQDIATDSMKRERISVSIFLILTAIAEQKKNKILITIKSKCKNG
jgi:hypothetical protein